MKQNPKKNPKKQIKNRPGPGDITWKSEKRKIKDLTAAKYNPRRLTDKQAKNLDDSLTKFNVADPIIINSDNRIIGGHQRIKILKMKGETEVDVRVPSRKLTEKEEKELNLRLNKNLGEWDDELLREFDKDMLIDVGFDSDELDRIFDFKPEMDEDDVPEMPEKTKTKAGDVFILGDHRIMCGDSTDSAQIEKLMQGRRAQMCFTDPPYNVAYTGGMGTHKKNKRSGIMNDKMSKEEFYSFLEAVCQNINEYVDGGVYICMSSSELDNLKAAWLATGGHWQSFIIWVKNNFTLSRSDYQNTYEPIMYGWSKRIKHHYFCNDRSKSNVWEDLRNIKAQFKDGYTTIAFHGYKVKLEGKIEKGQVIKKRQKTDIWRHDKPNRSEEHPTMKPVALCSEGILGSSKRDQIVLDLFLGSGSTLIACEKTGRICYGMEMDPKYCDVTVQRWEEYACKEVEKL